MLGTTSLLLAVPSYTPPMLPAPGSCSTHMPPLLPLGFCGTRGLDSRPRITCVRPRQRRSGAIALAAAEGLPSEESSRCRRGTFQRQLASRPMAQLLLLLPLYSAQLLWVSQIALQLPGWLCRVLPRALHGLSTPADNVLGVAVFGGALAFRKRLACPRSEQETEDLKEATAAETAAAESTAAESTAALLPFLEVDATPQRILNTTGMLLVSYLASGYMSIGLGGALYCLVALGLPLTFEMHNAIQVLGGHLCWVCLSLYALNTQLRPFFPPPFGEGRWIRMRWRTLWLPWVLGGYCASLLVYNVAEALNCLIMPVTAAAADSTAAGISAVERLTDAASGGSAAFLLGAAAPCVSAPIFEEVGYRGFLLPALLRFGLRLRCALPLNALLFGAQHGSLQTVLPLSCLGLLWALLYVRSCNLIVCIIIHAMWNSRIFADAWLASVGL